MVKICSTVIAVASSLFFFLPMTQTGGNQGTSNIHNLSFLLTGSACFLSRESVQSIRHILYVVKLGLGFLK